MSINSEISCKLKIQKLHPNHISQIVRAFSLIGWQKPASIYENYLIEQGNGCREVWVAFNKNEFVGYVTLNWQSMYQPFRHDNIPEIMDLNVLPQFQKQGVGSYLLDYAEKYAFETGKTDIGIGVGLLQDYGAAQRLYIRMGYLPDGLGITYNYQQVKYNELVTVDDDLVLWLTKKLN
ncbi:MAG: GNAT family N-acetyltransferase [Neisseriales bacterium]|nr:MAG: GNAT family N-acetyltransferase [Neisseriales bacterium]